MRPSLTISTKKTVFAVDTRSCFYFTYLVKEDSADSIAKDLKEYNHVKSCHLEFDVIFLQYFKILEDSRLLFLHFYTVADYLYLLMQLSKELGCLGDRAMIYLAAAVSDFHLPETKLVFYHQCALPNCATERSQDSKRRWCSAFDSGASPKNDPCDCETMGTISLYCIVQA